MDSPASPTARADALRLLVGRYGTPATTMEVGPSVDAVATAAEMSSEAPGTPRHDPPTIPELAAALLLLPAYEKRLEQVARALIGYARAPGPSGRPRLTFEEIGLLLGFPASTAKQRTRGLAIKLGIIPGPGQKGPKS